MKTIGAATSNRVTIVDVAREAGVSYATVSRVLNDDPYVKLETRERVTAALDRMGYVANRQARSLRTGRSQLVGVVLPDLANPVFAPILGGIEAELARHGYSALVAHAPAEAGAQQELVDRLIGRRVDGLILATVRRCVVGAAPRSDRVLDLNSMTSGWSIS